MGLVSMIDYVIGSYVEYMITELHNGKYSRTFKGNIGNWFYGYGDSWEPVTSNEQTEKLDEALNKFKYHD